MMFLKILMTNYYNMLECFPGSHRYSEWIREEKLSRLFKRIDKIFNMHTSTYKIHFEIQDWEE